MSANTTKNRIDSNDSKHVVGDQDPLLIAEGLSVQVEEQPLVIDFSLTLQSQEIVALMGPSGTGKTTLLRAMAGLIDPTQGTLRLQGQTAEALTYPRYRGLVMYLAERPTFSDETVQQNLERPFTYRTRTSAFDRKQAERLFFDFDLPLNLFEKPATILSAGEQQRVALVRALLLEPTILLLDEPTSALDPQSTQKAEHALRKFVDTGSRAIFTVSHNPEQVERWCDRSLSLPNLQEQNR